MLLNPVFRLLSSSFDTILFLKDHLWFIQLDRILHLQISDPPITWPLFLSFLVMPSWSVLVVHGSPSLLDAFALSAVPPLLFPCHRAQSFKTPFPFSMSPTSTTASRYFSELLHIPPLFSLAYHSHLAAYPFFIPWNYMKTSPWWAPALGTTWFCLVFPVFDSDLTKCTVYKQFPSPRFQSTSSKAADLKAAPYLR